jgi:S-adenosylmethionine:tRNA ribosyltransferase-isomerase
MRVVEACVVIAADRPVQRAPDSKLLYLDEHGRVQHARRCELAAVLRPGDLVIANDAATLPASLQGIHDRTGESIEVRLAGRSSLAAGDVQRFVAIAFGTGDHRTRTEDRPLPPVLRRGDELKLGELSAIVERTLDHPRLIEIRFDARTEVIWRSLAAHGRPIQYAHMHEPLALWDVWTSIAGVPVAYEPPSAGFVIDWQLLDDLHARSIEFATLTHAAGLSSTGDPELDRRLPFDEPYRIPFATALVITRALEQRRRIVAVGTTVVRALEDSARRHGHVLAGDGVATIRIDAASELRVVNAILSGTHEPGTSHYELLRAFAAPEALRRADDALNAAGYRTHEFGDSVLIERDSRRYSRATAAPGARAEAETAACVFPEMQVLAARAAPRILPGFSRTAAAPTAAHVVQEPGRLPTARRLVHVRQ